MNLTINEATKIIEYCSSFDQIDDIFDSEKGFNYFAKFIKHAKTIFFDETEFMKICEENSFYEFFNNILCLSASNIQLSTIKDYTYFDNILHFHETTSRNERKVFFLVSIVDLINRFITSIKFRTILIEKNGLKTHLDLIKVLNEDEEIFDKRYFGVIILNVNWLSKLADENKNIWTDLKAIDILTNYMRNFEFYKIYAIMILANIADDKDLESLAEFDLAIEIFTEMSVECISQPNKVIEQEFFNLDKIIKFKIKNIIDVENNCLISITGLLLALYKISINDKRKSEIYKKPNFKESLLSLIYAGNDAEKQHAIQLLIQLCFDKDILFEIKKESELVCFIQNLLSSKTIEYKQLEKACSSFLWILKQEDKIITSNGKHVMKSYNSATRELCLKIRDFLMSKNFDVWIDTEDINGSSCDSMAKAIEDSQFVLICVTEKYRKSYACEGEAKYAYKLKKNIIPCIMEKGYHSVGGWLGFIISDKIFIDFTKYELDDCFKRLLNQIMHLKNDLNQAEKIEKKADESIHKNDKQDFINWDHGKTKEWFLKNSFEEIFKVLEPINGKGLRQLNELHTHTPEFFYKSLTASNSITMKDVINFVSIFKDLVENKE